jgi:glycosyltransferase involved in cell wall biosynthesis
MSVVIFDPDQGSANSSHRGGGRFLQMLRENLENDATFSADLHSVQNDDTLLIPFWNAYRPAVVKKRYTKRQILTIFDVIPFKYPDKFPLGFKGKLGLIENLNNMQHFDEILTISEASKRDIMQYLNIEPERIHVVHLTTSKLFFEKSEDSKKIKSDQTDIPNLPFCVYVGDINWNKNIVNIARALKIAQIKGVFIGKAFTEEYTDLEHPERAEFKAFKKEVAQDDNFVFPGYVSDEDLVAYYKKALCNILVSRDEGFGLSYLEASSQKCPSILSDISVFNEIADGAALFAQPDDAHSIAEKIVRLKEDKDYAKELAANAYKRAQKFKPEAFTKKIKEILWTS